MLPIARSDVVKIARFIPKKTPKNYTNPQISQFAIKKGQNKETANRERGKCHSISSNEARTLPLTGG